MSKMGTRKCAAAVLAIIGWAIAGPAFGAEAQRYIVGLREVGEGRSAVNRVGGEVLLELGPQRALAARLSESAAAALRSHPAVEYVEVDPQRFPLAQTVPYGIPMVEADQVWSLADGSGKTVCVIDSGLQLGHADLQTSNVTGEPSGWDRDRCGHGTHVTGTIAALNNTIGVVGVLPGGIRLHIVKVFGDDCSWSYASDLVHAANRCAAAGAHIISMSLGGSFKSRTEERAFAELYSNGLLSVAAAGNGGNNRHSYPASYDSVISVAAIDANKQVASFSQFNDQVELAAPGVSVLSTVPWNETNSLTVDGVTYTGNWIENAARTSGVTGALIDGGLCDQAGSWSGKVVLCERGSISFHDKVRNVQSSGGVAAVIYNNASGSFFGTLGDGNASAIPAISVSQEDGAHLVQTALGSSGRVVSVREDPGSGYEAWNGTSMATPHVSGVAALIWSAYPTRTNEEIRQTLRATAQDLGAAGRDDRSGHGLLQARAAFDALGGGGGGGGTANTQPTASFDVSCSALDCVFIDTSTDTDGTLVRWAWDFGDLGSSTSQHPTHSYAAGGTYTVMLTVTDDGGLSSSHSQSVTVATASAAAIQLSVTPWKLRGLQRVDLAWSGATTASVDLYRDATLLTTTQNDGAHTDVIDRRGGGSYTYRVCEAGSTTSCSDQVTATF